jgi:hypothetical protein
MNGFLILSAVLAASAPPPEILEAPDGTRQPGLLAEDPAGGFAFRPATGNPFPLSEGMTIRPADPPEATIAGAPPFRALLGSGQQVSGRLLGFDAGSIRLETRQGAPPVTIARPGALALTQRSGEALLLDEDFESLPAPGWEIKGDVSASDRFALRGRRSARLAPPEASLARTLPKPLDSGRVELAFRDEGDTTPDASWSIDFVFRRGLATERIVITPTLGWSGGLLAVRSFGDNGAPALAVQHLVRKPGWRRMIARFGPGGISIAVDGDELARSREWPGALLEVRFACQSKGKVEGREAFIDDLRIVRLAEPSGPGEVDPTQDGADLITGDQWFGDIPSGDAAQFSIEAAGRTHRLSWDQVARVNFRRTIHPGKALEGLWVRASWRAAPDPHDEEDRIDGVLRRATDEVIAIETPYAGTIEIPRRALTRLSIQDRAWRWVLDDRPRHLGDEPRASLDPPFPQGSSLEIPFELPDPPPPPLRLAVEVLEVAGEAKNLQFSSLVREGLRSNVKINGEFVDYLNRYIGTENATPETVRLALPDGLLKAGKNTLRLEQSATPKLPNAFDEVGFLKIQLERPLEPKAPPQP